MICLNKNSAEYQTALRQSGLSENIFDSFARQFVEEFDRYPRLDEIPFANSQAYVEEALDMKNGAATVEAIEAYTKTSINNAMPVINDKHSDLEINIIPLLNEAIVDITHRPSPYAMPYLDEPIEVDNDVNDSAYLIQMSSRLEKLYGVKINPITNVELKLNGIGDQIPDSYAAKGFIYNGEVYINLDNASVDTPIHELTHLLLGSFRSSNPEAYQELVSLVEQLPNYQLLAQKYPNRTRNDVNEEIFVSELAKSLTGHDTILNQLDEKAQYEIFYQINRMLDSMTMGAQSTRVLSKDRLFAASLKEVAEMTGSRMMNNTFSGSIDTNGADIHRIMANRKEELMRSNELKEYCN